jgi:hypothetical protein
LGPLHRSRRNLLGELGAVRQPVPVVRASPTRSTQPRRYRASASSGSLPA